jgi:hypothetical protein
MKSLMSASKFWMIFADPEQPLHKAIDQVITRSYNKFGIFVDYDCARGREYLLEVSPITHPSNTPDLCPTPSFLTGTHLSTFQEFITYLQKKKKSNPKSVLKLCMATHN